MHPPFCHDSWLIVYCIYCYCRTKALPLPKIFPSGSCHTWVWESVLDELSPGCDLYPPGHRSWWPLRLTPPLQKALLNTLRRGVVNAAGGSAAGFLEERTGVSGREQLFISKIWNCQESSTFWMFPTCSYHFISTFSTWSSPLGSVDHEACHLVAHGFGRFGRWSSWCIKPSQPALRCLGGRRRSDRQPGIMGEQSNQAGTSVCDHALNFFALFNQRILGDIWSQFKLDFMICCDSIVRHFVGILPDWLCETKKYSHIRFSIQTQESVDTVGTIVLQLKRALVCCSFIDL